MTIKKKTMRRWDKTRLYEAMDNNLKGWNVVGEVGHVTAQMKIEMTCGNGHENIKYPSDLERGKSLSCRQCNKIQRANDTYNKYIEILEAEGWTMISSVDELIESGKTPSQTPIRVSCPHGKELTKRFNSFSNMGTRCTCPKCLSRGRKRRKWSLENVQAEYEKRGFIFKGTEWKTTKTKYETECGTCDHIWSPSFNSLVHMNSGCPICSNRFLSLETLTEWTRNERPQFEIPSGQTYQNSRTKMKIKCIQHDEIFHMRANEFKNGGQNGCSQCNQERMAIQNKAMNSQYDTKGSNNPMWSGLRPLARHLRTRIGDWRTSSFETNDYTCQLSKIRGGSLEVHHVTPFNSLLRWTMNITKLPIYESVGEYSEEQLSHIETVFIKLHDIYGKGILLSQEIHNSYHEQVGNKGESINIETFTLFVRMFAHENNVNLTQLIHELQEQKRINEMVAVNYSFQSA